MPVTIEGQTKPASQWAAERGLKWQTVKMRRFRGWTWAEALHPELRRRGRWMECFSCGTQRRAMAC
ncbi:hypothetical protein D3C84_1236330 [compost metagenome]